MSTGIVSTEERQRMNHDDSALILMSGPDALRRDGVIFAPIDEAAKAHERIFREHFMTQEIVLGSKKFAALHKAWVKSGAFLFVPPNVEIEAPVEIFHWLCGDGVSTFPHT